MCLVGLVLVRESVHNLEELVYLPKKQKRIQPIYLIYPTSVRFDSLFQVRSLE